jgi:HD-GYP domain-containing protein (c-di-GMP phosphodiesterase class II)
VAIAHEMKLREDSCVYPMSTAALIHDVGKIAVPIEILSRPGKLVEAEFQLIRERSQRGHDILKRARLP